MEEYKEDKAEKEEKRRKMRWIKRNMMNRRRNRRKRRRRSRRRVPRKGLNEARQMRAECNLPSQEFFVSKHIVERISIRL